MSERISQSGAEPDGNIFQRNGEVMRSLPKAMSQREIDAAVQKSFDTARPAFAHLLLHHGIPDPVALSLFKLGFMQGGLAATQRIQEYVDAGGELQPSWEGN